jgi:succinate dehydrogenase / fumarate reductase cytochrome b subunit
VSRPLVQPIAPAAPVKAMARSETLIYSSIGKKAVMAVTGILLVGFVFLHMLGNLQVFLGPKAMNDYAAFLREFLHGQGLWIARGGLLVAVALHVWAATSLTLANLAARPVGYRAVQHQESTYASRTMVWGGPLLLLFILYHLAHLTTGHAHPRFIDGDAYRNLVVGLQNPWASAFYVLAMLALGLHLYHGVWSMLQSLGLSHPRWNPARRALASLVAGSVVAGNLAIVVAVFTGRVHL